MKEPTRQKRCPICEKIYPYEDNYCGDDGSALEVERGTGGKASLSDLAAMTK